MTGPVQIVTPFPTPPALIREALANLRIARCGDADEIAVLGDLDRLPRPWDPATCPHHLRHQLWLWCDDVVTWLNHEYAWRTAHLIPTCWPQHPHLAHELPLLACQRVHAAAAFDPDLLEDWHRHTLPLFLDRLVERLGESPCRTGRHIDWPAAARHDAATTPERVRVRQELFYLDANPPRRCAAPPAGRPARNPANASIPSAGGATCPTNQRRR